MLQSVVLITLAAICGRWRSERQPRTCSGSILQKTTNLGPSISCWSRAYSPCRRACQDNGLVVSSMGLGPTGGAAPVEHGGGHEEERAHEEPSVRGDVGREEGGAQWAGEILARAGEGVADQELEVYSTEEMEETVDAEASVVEEMLRERRLCLVDEMYLECRNGMDFQEKQ
ncbi:thymidine phosphorylase [Striga asiatica]|uniref:Thymidine phosphorylase n=1 Tax=Striga asiatica TaxID=4170 RepID=A0A5A7QC54_STRAF|nr:thymidine phosphorylase [Striga asiatica]